MSCRAYTTIMTRTVAARVAGFTFLFRPHRFAVSASIVNVLDTVADRSQLAQFFLVACNPLLPARHFLRHAIGILRVALEVWWWIRDNLS
jgi:hypothetical protein